MVFHGDKCRHCRANMSDWKEMTDGPKKGWLRSYCIKCGHIEFKQAAGATGGQQQQQPQQQQMWSGQLRPTTPPPPGTPPRPANPFQPILVKRPPAY